MNKPDEKLLFEQTKKSGIKAFETLFYRYYSFLCAYASKMLDDRDVAEEIVQDLFVEIWEKRAQLIIETSIKSYLFQSVRNRCLNLIQHHKIRTKYAERLLSETAHSVSVDEVYVEFDLAEKIEDAIGSLPEKRQEIFRLSREEGLKYREIAEKLNISIKTVETQMSLAIKTLRERLKEYRFWTDFTYTAFCLSARSFMFFNICGN